MNKKRAIVLFVILSLVLSPFSTLIGVKQVTAAAGDTRQPSQDVQSIPVADPQSVVAIQGYYNPITLTGSDPDGDPLTFIIIDPPDHGVLEGDAPYLDYKSDANYAGPDSFRFVVTDNIGESAPATVSITVRTNADPVADPQSVVAIQGYYNPITLTGSDPDGDPLTFIIIDPPDHGVLEGDAPYLDYKSDANYAGPDSFRFVVTDNIGESAPATVSITVRTNADPVANPQSVVAIQGYYNPITLTGSDPDGDPLTFIIIDPPDHGVLEGDAPYLDYKSDANYAGPDSFRFVVTDNIGESAPATVSITVRTNADPVADPQSVVAIQGYYNPITLTGSDPDGDPLTFIIIDPPDHGVLEGDAPYLDYKSDANYAGPDSFRFVVTDNIGESAPATVSITVRTNADPVADPQSVVAIQGYYNPITLTGSDPDGDPLTFIIIDPPDHGVLEGDAPYLDYKSDANYAGPDSFRFVVTDNIGESAPATVSITVRTNADPVADPQSVVAIQGYYNPITLTGSDPDGDPLTFIIIDPPDHGVLEGDAPYLDYKSDANYAGPDSFRFVVTDNIGESAPATVSITVRTNADPVANPQSVVAIQGYYNPITLTGSDPDGDPLTFIIIDPPDHGVLEGDAPYLDYKSDANYAGPDSFRFVVTDNIGESAPATVSITVVPAGPTTVFFDDFETSLGWVRNPFGTDKARSGFWERARPQSTWYRGYKQLGQTVSGRNDLVTGPRAGWSAGDYDVDSGNTTIRSPRIDLPTGRELELTLSYYFAHASNSSSSDFLRIKIIGETTVTIFQELGAQNNDDASWASFTTSLSNFAGQSIYILIEAADYGSASLVEAAIDDVLIVAH